MNKLDQTDPRINLILEEFLERDQPTAAAPVAAGTSRLVETEFGRKVILKDTAGRGFNEASALSENAQENHDFEPFVSTSGVFGFSKVEQFKQILDRKKEYVN